MIDYAIILDRKFRGMGLWSITANDYDQFIWQSDEPKPTKKQLDDLWVKVQDEIKTEAEAKASSKSALLTKLGITEDEAKLLLS